MDAKTDQINKIAAAQESASGEEQAAQLKKITSQANLRDKKIGQILVDEGLINVRQLSEALYVQRELEQKQEKKLKIGEILLFSDLIKLPELQDALRCQTNKLEKARREAEVVKEKMEQRKRERDERMKMFREEFGFGPKKDDEDEKRRSFVQRFVDNFK